MLRYKGERAHSLGILQALRVRWHERYFEVGQWNGPEFWVGVAPQHPCLTELASGLQTLPALSSALMSTRDGAIFSESPLVLAR